MMLSRFREVDLLFMALNKLGCANGRMNDFEAENVLRRELAKLDEGETAKIANQSLHEKRHLIPKDEAPDISDRFHTRLRALRTQGLLQQQKKQNQSAQGASV